MSTRPVRWSNLGCVTSTATDGGTSNTWPRWLKPRLRTCDRRRVDTTPSGQWNARKRSYRRRRWCCAPDDETTADTVPSAGTLFARSRPATRSTGRARAPTVAVGHRPRSLVGVLPTRARTHTGPVHTRGRFCQLWGHSNFFFMSRSFTARSLTQSLIPSSRSPVRPLHSHHSNTRRLSRNTRNNIIYVFGSLPSFFFSLQIEIFSAVSISTRLPAFLITCYRFFISFLRHCRRLRRTLRSVCHHIKYILHIIIYFIGLYNIHDIIA